jgi:CO dehydrogenase/acetyl-CoA synthase epsilon subunit
MHGSIFGAMAAFLGARYFLSVKKLKAEVYKESSRFSLSNFKRKKWHRTLTKIR